MVISILLLLSSCATVEPTSPPSSTPPTSQVTTPVGPVGPPPPEKADQAPPLADAPAKRPPAPAASSRTRPPRTGGAYFQDDGPGENPPSDIDTIPDAVPRAEALKSWANRPYTVFGKRYLPEQAIKTFRQRGMASWYGRKFHGNKTAIGERYNMYAMTAAHPTLPIPSYARVTNVRTGQSVVVRVNDRGPFLKNRVIDLSYTAAHRLGYLNTGSAEVEVEQLAVELNDAPRSTEQLADQTPPVAQPLATRAQPQLTAQGPEAKRAPQVTAMTPAVKGVQQSSLTELSSNTETQAAPAERPDAAQTGVVQNRRAIYVQLGAFQSRDNARWLRAHLDEHFEVLGGRLEIHEQDGWFKVQAGPFEKREEALTVQAHIKEATDFSPFLTVRQASAKMRPMSPAASTGSAREPKLKLRSAYARSPSGPSTEQATPVPHPT